MIVNKSSIKLHKISK